MADALFELPPHDVTVSIEERSHYLGMGSTIAGQGPNYEVR